MNNPYGSYTRHNTTTAEHVAALWKEVAREHAARSSSARRYARDCHDSMDAAIRRANKAVQERDELRQTRRRLLGKVDQLEVKLRNSGGSGEQPHPLTADNITDEMRERAWLAWVNEETDDAQEALNLALTAALTQPQPRPEGAEEIEAYMREIVASHSEDHYGELADHLASRGVLPPLTDKTNPVRAARRDEEKR